MKIESYLPVFPGFYGSLFECDCEENVIEDGKTYDDYEFDYEDYHNRVARACVKPIENQLSDFGITIKFQKLVSPKFYNYSNDSINVEYTLQPDSFEKVVQYCKDNLDEFKTFLRGKFKSYDGFSSFFDYNSDTWFDEYLKVEHDKIATTFGSILEFILENEEYTVANLYEDVSDETHYISSKLK